MRGPSEVDRSMKGNDLSEAMTNFFNFGFDKNPLTTKSGMKLELK
jgi:hypothetical protein